jgi:hypothetical protein
MCRRNLGSLTENGCLACCEAGRIFQNPSIWGAAKEPERFSGSRWFAAAGERGGERDLPKSRVEERRGEADTRHLASATRAGCPCPTWLSDGGFLTPSADGIGRRGEGRVRCLLDGGGLGGAPPPARTAARCGSHVRGRQAGIGVECNDVSVQSLINLPRIRRSYHSPLGITAPVSKDAVVSKSLLST